MKQLFPTLGIIGALAFPHATAPRLPAPPAGFTLAYSHNFATDGLQGWSVQQGSTAPVGLGADGVAITVTKADQSTEVMSDGEMVIPGSFIQGRVYLPAVNGQLSNFPAFWANLDLNRGEIDMVEGLTGRACSHTHYIGQAHGLPGVCASGKTAAGWHTYSALWQHGTVTFWYDGTLIGSQPLPETHHEHLLFQNRSLGTYCPPCYGPAQYPSRDWLQWVKVWTIPAK